MWGFLHEPSHAQHDMRGVISSTGSSQVRFVSLDVATILRIVTRHDREGPEAWSYARHERDLLAREVEKDQNGHVLAYDYDHFVRSSGMFSPLIRLHSCQESCTLPPDHARLCSPEMPENAESTGVCQALLSMIRYLR